MENFLAIIRIFIIFLLFPGVCFAGNKYNVIREYTAGNGVEIDPSAGTGVIVKDQSINLGFTEGSIPWTSNTGYFVESNPGLIWDNGNETLDITQYEGLHVHTAKVDEAAGITKGDPVYVTGATGDKETVAIADNTSHFAAHAFGIANETKADGQNIEIAIFGDITGLNTSGFSEGAIVHLGAGVIQEAIPTSGAHIHLGRVSKSDVSAGIISINIDDYVHDIRATTDIDGKLATGSDTTARKFIFENYSATDLGYFDGAGNWVWNGPTWTFQPSADSVTAYQILDNDGGTPVVNVDTTNERVGIGTATPATTLDVVGVSRLGDSATNYASFASDGELSLAGTARVIVSVDIEPQSVKLPAVNNPQENTEDNFPTHDYDDTTEEMIYRHFEIPHDYASAGLIRIHVEYFVDTAPVAAANVGWGVEYKKLSAGDTFDFGAGTSTAYVTSAVTTGTPANDKVIIESGNINLTTTGFAPGDVLLLRIFRDATGTGSTDDFTGDARALDYHLEYLSDKLGEAT